MPLAFSLDPQIVRTLITILTNTIERYEQQAGLAPGGFLEEEFRGYQGDNALTLRGAEDLYALRYLRTKLQEALLRE